jgi:hypothetical protein
MGIRSTFITEHYGLSFPQWFVDKWSASVHFGGDGDSLPISSKYEAKTYHTWVDLEEDIRKASNEGEWGMPIVLVWLHECGGITRVEIHPEVVLMNEPESWRQVTQVGHDYCDDCSKCSPSQPKT